MSVTTKHTKDTKRELPPGWRWVRLGDVCESRTGIRDPKATPEVPFQYVDIASVDNSRKWIASAQTIQGKNAPSRARQVIRTNDVLVATTRPNLNAVALVPQELDNQICSTGFCVLRANRQAAPDYLFAFVRHTGFVDSLTDLVKGALYPAVNDGQVFSQLIPLPPLAEQQRITGILKEQMAAVDTARVAAEARLEAVKALPAALLRQVFPLPGKKLPEGWRWITLGTMISETRNGFGRRPQPGEDGPIVLRLADVSKGFIDLSEPRRGEMSDKEFMTYSLHAGDILFVRVNGSSDIVGRSIIVEPDHHRLVFNDHLIRVRLNDKLLPKYLRVYCDAPIARQHFMDSASTSAGQLTINRDSLDSMPLPLPPLPEQRSVVAMLKDKMDSADKARAAAEAELAAINALPATLLRRAFNGEL